MKVDVIGENGTGKSTLINACSDNGIIAPEGKLDGYSLNIKSYSIKNSEGIGKTLGNMIMIDTPGAFNASYSVAKYLKYLSEPKRVVDCVLLTLSCLNPKCGTRDEDKQLFKLLFQAFGNKYWSAIILVLTFANTIPGTALEFNKICENKISEIEATLKQLNLPNLPIVFCGIRGETLRGKDWIDSLTNAIKKSQSQNKGNIAIEVNWENIEPSLLNENKENNINVYSSQNAQNTIADDQKRIMDQSFRENDIKLRNQPSMASFSYISPSKGHIVATGIEKTWEWLKANSRENRTSGGVGIGAKYYKTVDKGPELFAIYNGYVYYHDKNIWTRYTTARILSQS